MVIQSTRSSSSSNNLSTTSTSRNAPPRTSPRRSRKPIRTSPALDLSSLKLDYDPSKEVPKSSRPMGLQDAPTYWPSDKEWADPLGYIQKIAPEGRKYGIIKVIPPRGWRPHFSVDTERFFFKTRKQELNSMEGATRSNLSYLDKLAKFHRQQGTTLTRLPSLDGKPMDLYAMKKLVDAKGGFKNVCAAKRWAEIGRDMGYGNSKNINSISTALKNTYQKYLLPYETYLEKAKPEFLREMGLTPSPVQDRKSSEPVTVHGVSRNLMDDLVKQEPIEEDKMDVDKSIKAESPAPVNGDVDQGTPTPSVNGLKRSFDESTARSVSAETEKESEPVRRESKRLKKAATAPIVVNSNMAQHAHAKPSRMSSMGSSPSKKPGENCEICGRGDNGLSMLLCDGCDTGYHTFCLDPPLKSIPKYDWYCTECLVGTNEFGFEDGEEYSLSQFQEKAETFRKDYIRSKLRPGKDDIDVPETEVEEEFWRMVSNVNETVEVEYGADVHCTTHGSGFPTVETNPTDPYATDPWNLNVMPLDNQSLFRHIKSDVSGMTVPWLYVGMMFSTFCWHNEDHYCYSINYQHFGATKTWYGIPGSDAEKFEAAMKNAVPELFETQPDLLFQLVTMLSPGRLVEEGVKVYAVDQRPNQFVITFPQAYHAGFNHGFNFNEAVNFAPSDWEEYGRACVKRYQEYRKMPVFSHDELLITAALHDSSIKTARWLTVPMDILVDRELQARKQIRESFPNIEETVLDEDLPTDDQYQCCVCKTYIYLSQLTCQCTTNVVCPSHVSELCDCNPSTRSLRLRYTDQDLLDLAAKISDRAKIPETWSQKFNAVISEYAKPPLRTLRSLLSEAERIPYPLPELASLKAFVERANDWVEEATAFVARKHQNRRKNERVWRSGSRAQELEERERMQRSPEYVYKLLDQADELGFEAVEIDLLREKAEAIEEFKERADAALEDGSMNLAEYTELIDEGKSLNVDLPALDTLERIVDQLKWVEKATEFTDLYLSLTEVVDLMDEGVRCGISPDHELMRQFMARRDKGLHWEEQAASYLAMESVSFEALEKLLDDALDLSIHKETYEKIESIIVRTREATQNINHLMAKTAAADIHDRPLLSDARRTLRIIDGLPVKPTESVQFKKMVLRCEEWIKHGKRLFGKTNSSAQQLEDHLIYVAARNEKVFDASDVPKGGTMSAGEEGGTEAKESEEGPYCICRSDPTGDMVECDKCNEWYHMKCLKISKKKFDQNDAWECPICDWRKEIPRSATRPSLAELKEWAAASPNLTFRPDELAVIDKIIKDAETWTEYIQPLLHGEQMPPLNKCRFYLRKLEGAEVFLPTEYNYFRRSAHALAPLSSTPPPLVAESKVARKSKPKKPKETLLLPQIPKMMSVYDSHPREHRIFPAAQRYDSHPQEQRILPAQRYDTPVEPLPYAERPRQPPLLPPLPERRPSHSYVSYTSNQMPTPPAQHLPSRPAKGMFAPPPVGSLHIVTSSYKMDDTPSRPSPRCDSCGQTFVPGAHNEPLACSQCQRLHHTLCIGKYGGRIYPAFVCATCVKRNPNGFQTLPPLPPKRPDPMLWGGVGSIGGAMNFKPMTAAPSTSKAVMDFHSFRSPPPEFRPATAAVTDSRLADTQRHSSQQPDVRNIANSNEVNNNQRNMSTPPSTTGSTMATDRDLPDSPSSKPVDKSPTIASMLISPTKTES